MSKCEKYTKRQRDLCEGRGRDGRPDPPPEAVAAFRYKEGVSGSPVVTPEPAQMPNIIVRGLNFTAALTRHAVSGFRTRAPVEIEERMEICMACPYRIDINGVVNCAKCGCQCTGNNDIFLNKLAWTSEVCPDGRWT